MLKAVPAANGESGGLHVLAEGHNTPQSHFFVSPCQLLAKPHCIPRMGRLG